MRDLALANVSGVVFEQTFNILADGNNSTTQGSFPQTTRFNPSMAIIIIVLISAFLFMGFFSIYVRRCTSSSSDDRNGAPGGHGGQGPRHDPNGAAVAGAIGLDRAVVENLPLVGYPLLKGLNGGKDMSECAVCLSDFEDDDDLRVLPKCGHVFHPECVDVWFGSHSTCPLCRASVGPSADSGKGSDDTLAHESHTGLDHEPDEEGRLPVTGPVVVEDAVTVHGRPPVPPNGSILELLTRDGVDRLVAQSLRRENSVNLDRGLSRREETEPIERSGELRALNRALSRNSTSMQVASKGLERSGSLRGERVNAAIAASAAALLASGTSNYNTSGNDQRDRRVARSMGSSSSFNFTLRRSSSAGLAGGYISKLFGNYGDHSTESESKDDGLGGDGTKHAEADDRVLIENSGFRRERSESELHRIGAPGWVSIDLGERGDRPGAAVDSSPNSARSVDSEFWGSRGVNHPGSAGQKYHSGEFLTDAKSVKLQGQLSGPLYVQRKGKEAVDESPKSEQFSFGQSLRRTFSLRRSSSDVKDAAAKENSSQQSNDSTKWWNQMLPSASASAKKLASPIVGAMKGRKPGSSTGDVPPTTTPAETSFPQSLPITSDQGQQQQQQQQQSSSPSAYPESIQVVSQP